MTVLAGRGVIGAEVWRAAREFVSGVSVVTAGAGEQVHGGTVSVFSVVSREPPMAVVALRGNSYLLDVIRRHGGYVINVLAAEQAELARRFARPDRVAGRAQFAGVPLSSAGDDVPVLAGAVCWLRCRPTRQLAAGDHELVLGEVVQWSRGAGVEPLLNLAGTLRSAHPE